MSVFIVAELSANHNQDLSLAKESLYAIKESGASAVKLQTYTPDSLTLDCKNEIFRIKSKTIWDNQYLYDLYKKAYMPLEWNNELFCLAKKIGLFCFSSAFDKESVDLLESLQNPIYKIASFEITDVNLISYIASKKKPIVLSSGIANNEDLCLAIEHIIAYHDDITLLKCTSAYPSPINELNLKVMQQDAQMLENKYNIKIKYGLSDHSKGVLAAIIATSLGASMIEKHFILDKKYQSVDNEFSLDKDEFKAMVCAIKETQSALKSNQISQKKGREFARSLFVSKAIKKGERFTKDNIKSIRPSNGLHPKHLNEILNKKASRDLAFGKPLEWEDIVKQTRD